MRFNWSGGRAERSNARGEVRVDGGNISHDGHAAAGPLTLGTEAASESRQAGAASGGAMGNGHAVGRGDVVGNVSLETRADRLLVHRLAQIDRMRDSAVENGDEALLRQADRLEVLARAQYQQRAEGTATVGAAMRDFNAAQRASRTEQDVSSGVQAHQETTGVMDARLKAAGANVSNNSTAKANAALDFTPVNASSTAGASASQQTRINSETVTPPSE